MSQEFQAGQTIGHGRFVLERELGRGGMGVVWLALDEHLSEQVALKFLPSQLASDPEAVDSLRREVSKSRKLSHPNIVRIHDLILSDDEPPFVSMEYIEGSNLSELKIAQPQQLFAWDSIEPVVRQLCSALDYAHQEKVVHRDLKPGNMMLDAEGRLKLADFGLAATLNESMSRMTADLGSSGTPPYMSPQQLDGRVPKAADDIYSLGATIYEFLTSKPPFFAGDIMHQVRSIPPQPMAERLADLELENSIPPAVAAMVMACLSKEREQRPESARIVAEWIGLDIGDYSGATSASLATLGLASSAAEWEEPQADDAVEPRAARSKGKALIVVPALALVFLVAVFFMMKGNGGKPDGAGAGASSGLDTPEENRAASGNPSATPHSPGGRRTDLLEGDFLENWEIRELGVGPGAAWTLENGVLATKSLTPNQAQGKAYNLVSKRKYENFDLELEFKISTDGNSGVFYCAPSPDESTGICPEYQLVDNDAPGNGQDELRMCGTVYGLRKASRQVRGLRNRWARMRLLVRGSHVEHWLEGEKMLEYDLDSRAFISSARAAKAGWNPARPGHIALQWRAKGCAFRNIMIKSLD